MTEEEYGEKMLEHESTVHTAKMPMAKTSWGIRQRTPERTAILELTAKIYNAGLSMQEIAEKTGMPINRIRSDIKMAREAGLVRCKAKRRQPPIGKALSKEPDSLTVDGTGPKSVVLNTDAPQETRSGPFP